MFCGIVTAVGTIASTESRGSGMAVRIACPFGWTSGMRVGASVAVNGACLTATEVSDGEAAGGEESGAQESGAIVSDAKGAGGEESGKESGGSGEWFCADLTSETLSVCAPFDLGMKVNLERPLRFGDEVGGHFVTGHVDGAGEVLESKDDDAGGRTLRIGLPRDLMMLFARKGSATVSGVSLTVNEVDATSFSVRLIPQTMSATTLGALRKGAKVNLEADPLSRHLARILEVREAGGG